MKFKTLVKKICSREGKKKVLNAGDVSEALACTFDEFYEMDLVEQAETYTEMMRLAARRARDRKRTRR